MEVGRAKGAVVRFGDVTHEQRREEQPAKPPVPETERSPALELASSLGNSAVQRAAREGAAPPEAAATLLSQTPMSVARASAEEEDVADASEAEPAAEEPVLEEEE
jgi:hypothetical protein